MKRSLADFHYHHQLRKTSLTIYSLLHTSLRLYIFTDCFFKVNEHENIYIVREYDRHDLETNLFTKLTGLLFFLLKKHIAYESRK